MVCRRCKRKFLVGSEEHIILEGLGGKTKTSLVFCKACNESFSQIDGALIKQFDFAKNILQITGKRGTVGNLMMKDTNGNPVVLRPGGKPIYLKPKSEELIKTDDKKIIKISIPPHILEQYKNRIEKEYGIAFDAQKPQRVTERPQLKGEFSFGGLDAYRSVAKMTYSLAVDHLMRHNLIANLSEIENYIFEGIVTDKLCMLDGRPEIYEEVDDLSNVIAIHFNAEKSNIIGSITILGSFGYSVLLSRKYTGENYTIRMKNDPLNADISDVFENKPLERLTETEWLISRPYHSDPTEWTSMGQTFAEIYLKKTTDLQQEIIIREIIEECMKEAGFTDEGPSIATEEMLEILSSCVAKKMAALIAKR